MTARLAPLEPPYAPDTEDALRRLMGSAPGLEPLRLFRVVAHNRALLDRFRQIGSTLLSFGTLDPDDRETVIHRTTARCGADYEWGVHARLFAGERGEDWLRATWSGGHDDPAFGERDALLVHMCDELHDTGALGDELYAELASRWSDEQLVELVCLAGFYHLVSFLCGAFAIAPEEWAATPPRPR